MVVANGANIPTAQTARQASQTIAKLMVVANVVATLLAVAVAAVAMIVVVVVIVVAVSSSKQ